jgi:hypothetical protein
MTSTIYRTRLPMVLPFLIAAGLMLWVAISPIRGFGPSNNDFFVFATLVIVIGLLVGISSLFFTRSVAVWARVLVGLLYAPTVLFSALIVGF